LGVRVRLGGLPRNHSLNAGDIQQPKNEMLISVITEAELLSTPTVCEDAGLKAENSFFSAL
jgi:hypothetical protein